PIDDSYTAIQIDICTIARNCVDSPSTYVRGALRDPTLRSCFPRQGLLRSSPNFTLLHGTRTNCRLLEPTIHTHTCRLPWPRLQPTRSKTPHNGLLARVVLSESTPLASSCNDQNTANIVPALFPPS